MKIEDLKPRIAQSLEIWNEVKRRWQELGLPGMPIAPHDALLTLLISELKLDADALAEKLLAALPRLKELRRDPHLAASFIGTGGSAMLLAALMPEESWQEFTTLLNESRMAVPAAQKEPETSDDIPKIFCANCRGEITKESVAHRCKICLQPFCFNCAVKLISPDYTCVNCVVNANQNPTRETTAKPQFSCITCGRIMPEAKTKFCKLCKKAFCSDCDEGDRLCQACHTHFEELFGDEKKRVVDLLNKYVPKGKKGQEFVICHCCGQLIKKNDARACKKCNRSTCIECNEVGNLCALCFVVDDHDEFVDSDYTFDHGMPPDPVDITVRICEGCGATSDLLQPSEFLICNYAGCIRMLCRKCIVKNKVYFDKYRDKTYCMEHRDELPPF